MQSAISPMNNITEQEVRALWQASRQHASDDELDIFFEEIFSPADTVTVRDALGQLTAAAQWSMRKMTFVGTPVNVGVVSGLVAAGRGDDRSNRLAEVLQEVHRKMYAQGVMYSVIVPNDEKERQWLADHGYTTSTYRIVADSKIPADSMTDEKTTIEVAEEWGHDLWIFYAQHGGQHDFELKLAENEFFAMIAHHDAEGGSILVARRRGRIVGFALVSREGKPLKSGKPSAKQFRVNLKFILAADERILYAIEQQALALAPDCKQVVITGCCPAKGFKGATPHAMTRVIDAERFLSFVAQRLPGLQLVTTVNGDDAIEANNRTFRLRDGRCYTSTMPAESSVAPGGVTAMFLSGQPVLVP